MQTQKTWQVKWSDPTLKYILSRELGVSPIVASLLINRGVTSVEEGRAFLDCRLERLHHPLMMKGIQTAVTRVLAGIKRQERILVYGDYDVDGITATALLVKVLTRLGARADYFIPDRLEHGYGLHAGVMAKFREAGFNLIITVDCGISNIAEVEENHLAGGPDIIITDHHEPPEALPPAAAVVNPRQPECPYPFKELAGVGVALKLAQALLETAGEGSAVWRDYLDLACLGTIADIVALLGENRILVKHGLPRLAGTDNAGLQALIKVSGINPDALGVREVGFALAPRLNAAGRMGNPGQAVDLLLSADRDEAERLARLLDRGNQERQRVESRVRDEAIRLAEQDPELAGRRVLILASPGWHPGVIGIVASRLADRYKRPALIMTLDKGEARGSARSVPGFNLHKALSACSHLLLAFGGHARAAGFSLREERLAEFVVAMNSYANLVLADDAVLNELELDALVDLDEISRDLVDDLSELEPYGHCNPGPLLGCLRARVVNCREVGRGGAHLKLLIRGERVQVDGIGFDLGLYAQKLSANGTVDLAFTPELNEWQGQTSVQLKVKDIKDPGLTENLFPTAQGEKIGQEFFCRAEKCLKRGYPFSFRAEFINCQVNTHNNSIPGLAAEAMSATISGPLMMDERSCRQRCFRLAELAGSGGCALVIGGSPAHTVEIACQILAARPALAGRVDVASGLQPEAEHALRQEQLAAGELKVIISTPSLAPLFGRLTDRVILCHLPFSPGEWSAVISAAGDRNLHLLYGGESRWWNIDRLHALAVSREYLGFLYNYLGHLKKVNRTNFSVFDALGTRPAFNCGCFREYSLQVGMSVLQDLGLVKYFAEGGKIEFNLQPRPREKLPLDLSPTYGRMHRLAHKLIPWQHNMLDLPADRLKLPL